MPSFFKTMISKILLLLLSSSYLPVYGVNVTFGACEYSEKGRPAKGSTCQPCFIDGIAYFRNNLEIPLLKVADAFECWKECFFKEDCRFWSFEKLTGRCYLKYAQGLAAKTEDYTSGNVYDNCRSAVNKVFHTEINALIPKVKKLQDKKEMKGNDSVIKAAIVPRAGKIFNLHMSPFVSDSWMGYFFELLLINTLAIIQVLFNLLALQLILSIWRKCRGIRKNSETKICDVRQLQELTISDKLKLNDCIKLPVHSCMKILECPVCNRLCWQPLKIFQCVQGHIVCETCVKNLKNCLSCKSEYKKHTYRNLGLENLAYAVYQELLTKTVTPSAPPDERYECP